jgi:hypothetical protein
MFIFKKNLPIVMETSKSSCKPVVTGSSCNTEQLLKESQDFGFLRLNYGNYSKEPGIIEKKDFRRIKM